MKACTRCQGGLRNISPLKSTNRVSVYSCVKCGYTFTSEGKAFVADGEALRDVFKGATLGNQAVVDMILGTGEEINAATRALLSARMLEYGLTMWMDGLKQGLLLGVNQDDARRNTQSKGVASADRRQPGREGNDLGGSI